MPEELQEEVETPQGIASPPPAPSSGRTVRILLGVAAVMPALALAFIAYKMITSAWPSIIYNGFKFFTTKTFSFGNLYGAGGGVTRHCYTAAPGSSFGILPFIFGTLVSSVIALLLAIPIAVGGAILLVERLPKRLQGTLSVFLDLLAGIPSVIFGLWGVYTFGPAMARDVYTFISKLHIPWLTGAVGSGEGLLTASLVLAAMIVPIIASTTRELLKSVPQANREAAAALGLTKAEGVRVASLPLVRHGIAAAALLGWGRALGETIAVLLISGNFLNGYPHNIFSPFATMASTIAAMLDAAFTDSTGMAMHALAEIGLVLLLITVGSNFAGRLVSRRLAVQSVPVGRGV